MQYYPILVFSYLALPEIKRLEVFLVSDISHLQALNSNYVIIRHPELERERIDARDADYCVTSDILYEEVMSFPEDHNVRKRYNELIDRFGSEKVDLCIIKDTEVVKQKILKIIKFVMDDLRKTDYLKIEFERFKEFRTYYTEYKGTSWEGTSMILNILYEVIQENFIIEDQDLDGKPNSIYIRRKGDN